MFTTFFFLSLVLSLLRTVFAQSDFTIDTPEMIQCQSTQITWNNTYNGPYDILVVSTDDMCGDALEDLGTQNSTSTIWTVNIAAGTDIMLYIEDAKGDQAWSGSVVVGNSSDTSCLVAGTNSSTPTSTDYGTAPSGVPTTPVTTSFLTTSALSPVSSANAGLASPSSAAFSTRPLSTVALFGSTVLAVVAFTL